MPLTSIAQQHHDHIWLATSSARANPGSIFCLIR